MRLKESQEAALNVSSVNMQILDGTQKSLERSFVILEKFGKASGLQVNSEKTEALWISSKKGSNQITGMIML